MYTCIILLCDQPLSINYVTGLIEKKEKKKCLVTKVKRHCLLEIFAFSFTIRKYINHRLVELNVVGIKQTDGGEEEEGNDDDEKVEEEGESEGESGGGHHRNT